MWTHRPLELGQAPAEDMQPGAAWPAGWDKTTAPALASCRTTSVGVHGLASVEFIFSSMS